MLLSLGGLGSFCVTKNILQEGAEPHCDLRLNTLLLLVEIHCSLGWGNDSDPFRAILPTTAKGSIVQTDEETGGFIP
jgi:hypothetical protein